MLNFKSTLTDLLYLLFMWGLVAIGLWGIAALVAGIYASGGIVAIFNEYLVATGLVTMVDYYTHIKGLEYIICVSFLVVFTLFSVYINKPSEVKIIK